MTPPNTLTPGAEARLRALEEQAQSHLDSVRNLMQVVGMEQGEPSRFEVLQGYLGVFGVAFLVTLLLTPLVRRLAIAFDIIDHPTDPRKQHKVPVAYLGGVAVFAGIMTGILYSYFALRFEGLIDFHVTEHLEDGYRHYPFPFWIVGGLTIIVLAGFLDDVYELSPRVKLGMQLMAAAGLAWGNIGTNLARGVLSPTIGAWLGNRDLVYTIATLPTDWPAVGWLTGGTGDVTIDFIYWSGAIAIALFVLGATNAANFIDGLDGLLSGTTAIATAGFLVIALTLAIVDDGPLDSARIILCLAVLGGCLGFLPHNFNPATIFLGDCGSLLLGYAAAVMILSLGDTGKTYLVIAGLIIYGIPITDTALAIVRRKLAGKRMSDPDADHLHHMLKRALGVKGAVFVLYAIGATCATLGVLATETRARIVYLLAVLFFSWIGVYAIKIARRTQLEQQLARPPRRHDPSPSPAGDSPAGASPAPEH
ncbi:MAG: MraY family glycosyltransferase [Phycisphaerales bacterium JB040]